MRKTLSTLSAAVLLGLSAQTFAALPQHVPDERSQAAQADLVFVGSVASVEYRQSGKDGDTQRVPHTFVTYNVEEVLHGKAESKQVTLRFIGGRGEKARFLDVTGQPMFDAGDRDLLIVANNGSSGCPLVSCSNGRYRFIEGKVFSEEGQSIELDVKGGLVKSGYYKLPEVMTHKVSQTLMTLNDHFEQGEERIELANSAGGAHLDEGQMISRVRDIARGLRNATPGVFRNVSVDVSFDLSFGVTAASFEKQSDPSDAERVAPQSAQERANGYSFHNKTNLTTSSGGGLSTVSIDGDSGFRVNKGQTVRAQFTYENNGRSTQAQDVRFVVSTNKFITTYDTTLKTVNKSVARNTVYTTADSITLPSNLISGRNYWVGVIFDANGTLSETTEANNAAYIPIRIN